VVRVALAAGIVAVLAGALLARVPFHDGEVRCGAPISGAAVSEDEAMEDVNLLSSCDDAGAGRVLVAGGLVFAGLVVMLAGLSVGEVRALGGPHRVSSGARTAAPAAERPLSSSS
jgi:hypothetical protein